MENTIGNDMDSTNPITGFSFINDSLFIDDSSLVFDAYFRTYLLLAEAGFESLRLSHFCGCRRISVRTQICAGEQAPRSHPEHAQLPGS